MSGIGRTSKIFVLALAGLLLVGGVMSPRPAVAAHDQGYICYVCHTLNPTQLRPGTRAILATDCVLATIPTYPTRTAWVGGNPISCDFCHKSATDIPTQNMQNKVAAGGSKHPVDLIATGDLNPTNEITCNDCHAGNGDLTPQNLLTDNTTDGYPNHLNVDNNYTHNLTNNPPHLTQPYWSTSSLPGVNRTNDGTFWTAVQAGTQSIVCWQCHDGTSVSPFTQVKSSKVIKSDYTDGNISTPKGHKIQTTVAGAMAAGSALPCYDCHDSHGAVNSKLILDNQSVYGTATAAVSVTTYVGASNRPDRVVCAQCHDTGNTVTAATKAVPTQAGKLVEGLYAVDPYNSTTSGAMHISAGVTDNMAAGAKNCLGANGGCHANPHNPVGESKGGQNCAVCHGTLYTLMQTGKSTGYHHVMLGDNAPVGNLYPTNQNPTGATVTDRTCLICHVDHNYFSKLVDTNHTRAQNLRRDILVQPDNSTNAPLRTDFDNTLTNGGICTSCHAITQTKRNPGTDIKNDGVASTAVVSKSLYNLGAHSYVNAAVANEGHFTSDNTDATSYFQSNCSKCHNDTTGTSFQDSSFKFGLHASDGANAVNNLLAPLGYTPLTDNLAANFCYRCHSHPGDGLAGTKKTTAGKDYYNNANMDNNAESTYVLFNRTSKHPLASVDCLSCHNVHATRSTTGGVVANPDNTYAFATYNLNDNSQAGITARSSFCLACHDGSGPVLTVTAATYIPKTITPIASSNKSTYGARGHWSASGALTSTTVKACDACHDKHGSTAAKLLGVFDNTDGVNKINGVAVSATVTAADNEAICNACHTNAGAAYPSTTVSTANITTQEGYRDATGYFSAAGQLIRWPGKAVYDNGSLSPHGTSAKTGPASLGSRGVADCNGCHDPHGTAYTYNMLTDNMAAGNYKLCFDCHGLSGSPAVDNIAQYYPSASSGLSGASTGTTNVGHNIKTAGGKLAAGTALPCYDCHVVHGSRNLNTQLKSDQRWSGLGNTKYGSTPSDNAADGANRAFCLGCHVASDGVAPGDTVEGLARSAGRLPLPSTNGIDEHKSASLQGCQRCHYGRNYLDNSYSPHYPGTGLCDTCHESQGTKGAAASTYNGAHREHTGDNTAAGYYKFACKQCHTWTGTAARATHKNDNAATQHAEVVFDNQAAAWTTIQYATATQFTYRTMYVNPFGAANPTPTYASGTDNATTDTKQTTVRWTNGTCSNVWCHSNANPLAGYGASNVYANTTTWVAGSLPADCSGCHGGDGSSASIIGDNTAAKNGSRAHYKHVTGGVGCDDCHYNTVNTSNNRLITGIDNHVNGVKDIKFSPTVGGSWDNSTKTCSSTSCHGASAVWTAVGTITCFSCHSGAEVAYKPVASNGGTANGVDNNQYLSTGHGRRGSNYPNTLNPGAAFDNQSGTSDCYYCHTTSGDTHFTKDANDPYRLGYRAGTDNNQKAGGAVGVWATNTDGLCLACHSSTAIVTKKATVAKGELTHSKANAGTGYGVWTLDPLKCVDCHDPHGDANNAMIRSAINAPTATGDNTATGAGSDNYGTPKRTAGLTTVNFTDNSGYAANSYAIPSGNGVCEMCHVQTGAGLAYTRGTTTATDNVGTHTSRVGTCTGCHAHNTGFKGAGHAAGSNCKSCHNATQGSGPTRRNIQPEFDNTYKHGGNWTTGTVITSPDCELCHYEAASDKIIKLKLYTSGTAYSTFTYDCTALYNNNAFCLGCHTSSANGSDFSVGGARTYTPQYDDNTTYLSDANSRSGAGVMLPVMTKARSPHGSPSTNKMKQETWISATNNQTKYTDAAPVACQECHPSHGSGAASPTKLKGSPFPDDPTFVGGKMILSAEPTMCWTCHDTAGVDDYWGDNAVGSHWTGFQNLTSSPSLAYKGRTYKSTHQVNDNTQPVACSICHNPHGASAAGQYRSPMLRGSWMSSPYFEDRAGKLNNSTQKATILSRAIQSKMGPRMSSDFAYNNAKGRGNGFDDNSTATGHDGYYIDENTFGVTGTATSAWTGVTAKHMVETVDNVAGLCSACHTDAARTYSTTVTAATTLITNMETYLNNTAAYKTGWGATIHTTVKGWAGGGTTVDVITATSNKNMHGYPRSGTSVTLSNDTGYLTSWGPWKGYNWQASPSATVGNQMASAAVAIHQFPCSKCHTPHASHLPRLATTNCLDVGTAANQRQVRGSVAAYAYPTPTGTTNIAATTGIAAMTCHNLQKANTSTSSGWNKVTGW